MNLWSVKAHAANLTCSRFTPDGTKLFTSSFDGTVKRWNMVATVPEVTMTLGPNLSGIAVEKIIVTASRVIAGLSNGWVKLLSHDGALQNEFRATAERITGLALHADEFTLAVGDTKGWSVWEVDGTPISDHRTGSTSYALAFRGDELAVAYAGHGFGGGVMALAPKPFTTLRYAQNVSTDSIMDILPTVGGWIVCGLDLAPASSVRYLDENLHQTAALEPYFQGAKSLDISTGGTRLLVGTMLQQVYAYDSFGMRVNSFTAPLMVAEARFVPDPADRYVVGYASGECALRDWTPDPSPVATTSPPPTTTKPKGRGK